MLSSAPSVLEPEGVRHAAVHGEQVRLPLSQLDPVIVGQPLSRPDNEHTTVRDEAGREAPADLWTTCFTPRELRLLAEAAGLRPDHVWSVTPGDYAARPPDIDHPEFLLVATRLS